MLNRRRRHQTPTFLEGTPGLYVKRESPPRVPSTAPIPTKTDVVSGSSNHSNASRSLSSSRSSLLQPSSVNGVVRKTITPMGACGASTPALVASTLYASASSIATTVGGDGSSGIIGSTTTTTSGFGPQFNNFSSMQNFSRLQQHHQFQNGHKHDVTGRRLSHTPIRPHRRAAPRHELSSHSFNNPPSSSWAKNIGIGAPFPTNGLSAMALNTCNEGVDLVTVLSQRNNLSNEIASARNEDTFGRRRHLVTSLSFGNVVESLGDDEPSHPAMQRMSAIASRTSPNARAGIVRQKTSVSSSSGIITNGAGSSISMQSLPVVIGSSILQDQVASSSTTISAVPGAVFSLGSGLMDLEADLPLPPNWEVEVTPDGIRYYVDHDHKRTHWIHPLAVENLSHGWIKIFDQVHGVVYYNEMEQRSQFEHPGLATSATVQFNSNTQPQFVTQFQIQNHQHPQILEECSIEQATTANFVEDLNIIDDRDVPEWIRLYSDASFESDHLLNWDLFDLSQLEEFDQMLMKLFKQDAINTVIKYERPRREINNELTRRNVVTS